MTKRWSAVAAGLAAVASLLGASYHWLVRRPLAQTRGTLRLAGLDRGVEIQRDPWGVPHIYAANEPDLLFAQGFVHAQDRLWQLDLQRRLVAGRLSEVMGDITVPVDRWIRILGLRWVAEQDLPLIGEQTRSFLERYAAGINARITQGRLPFEFTLLRYEPEPWTIVDTLSWAKFMSWSLSVNWESELLRAQLIALLGPERAAELEPQYPSHRPTIVPPPNTGARLGQDALERAEAARPFTGPPARAGLGSNNWVLSGARTASGSPLLANDMHLPMNLPCIWYENHLVGGELELTGVTFPGIPLVVAGHNGHVAWGHTNGFPDVQDLYIEQLRRTTDGRVQYRIQDEWHDARVIAEEIRVRGGSSVVEEVIVTRHGPILNALAPDLAGEGPAASAGDDTARLFEGLALRWTSLEPDAMVEALVAMARARDCVQFREALRHWAAPVQNIVYADTAGNIGYSFPGKVPIRARGDGRVPVPGWTDEYKWIGYVPFDELPHLFNPSQGYVATANNRVVDDKYPYVLGTEYAFGDRAQRIVELIEAREKIDVAYVQRMQFDQVSLSGRAIARHLGQLAVDDPELAEVAALMRGWDGTISAESPAAAIHQVFVRRMIARMVGDRLGELSTRYAGQGPTPLLAEGSMFGEKSWAWLLERLGEPDSHWFDLGGGESRDDVMRLALRETIDFLKSELGPRVDHWAWGKLHTLTYTHVLGRVRPLNRLLNRGPYQLGGDGTTLWATGTRLHDLSSDGVVGPPFRFIVDLGDLRNSWSLLAPGQSGQPGSKHYDDQIQAWFRGQYHPMLWFREDVERRSRDCLRLLPAAKG